MNEEMLTIADVARLYRKSKGAIHTAIWRYKREGVDPGFPVPFMVGRRYRWLRSVVSAHLKASEQQTLGNSTCTGQTTVGPSSAPIGNTGDLRMR